MQIISGMILALQDDFKWAFGATTGAAVTFALILFNHKKTLSKAGKETVFKRFV
jgi:hypothetical protein